MTKISKDRLFELLDHMIEWDNEKLDRLLQDDDYRSEEDRRETRRYFRHVNEGYVQALKCVKAVVKVWGTSEDYLYNEGDEGNDN